MTDDGAFEDALRLVDPEDRIGAAGVIELDCHGEDVAVDLMLDAVDLEIPGPAGHFIVQLKRQPSGVRLGPRTLIEVAKQLRTGGGTPFEVFVFNACTAAAQTWDDAAVRGAAADYVRVDIEPTTLPRHDPFNLSDTFAEASRPGEQPRLRTNLKQLRKFLQQHHETRFLVDRDEFHHDPLHWRIELPSDPERHSPSPPRLFASGAWFNVPTDSDEFRFEPEPSQDISEDEATECQRPRPRTIGMIKGTPPDYATRHKEYRRGGARP